ncbi:Organic solute transporter Ost-alpha [Macleaya cordata]|uniref:Organic solute transporter Ost-alpha n=1 Tax=Macleaya cordata TaxID=56857 RepID=A0A200QCV3_MACCD|nr:Organic solute transporter Ost-alpha [Macleaya cordata]
MVEDVYAIGTSSFSNFHGTYSDLHLPALIIGGIFVLVALCLSIFLILQHLRSYTNPAEQKWIVAVVFMVPFYACESIISLWNARLAVACDILRNCYEAFALYSFGSYLVACIGGERRVVELLEYESRKHLSEPLLEGEDKSQVLQNQSLKNFCFNPRVLGENLYTIVKFGIVQYMILKTFCSFLALLLELCGVYGDGEFKWYYGYPYIAAVLNFSQMWALLCLVQFYNMTHENLQPIKPLAKFISFKAIVFATWWQGMGIAILCAVGVLPKEGKFQHGLQDFLICVEMAIAAVAHVFVFSAEPYRFLTVSEQGKVTSLTTKAKMKIEEDGKEKPAVVERKETQVEAPGTSVTESVQDIVIGGGQHVVKDVVLTINQAIEPVEKGVTKIQERFHHVSVDSDNEGPKLEVERVQENITRSGSNLVRTEEKVITPDETDK